MITYQMTQTVCVSCDHCGAPASRYVPDIIQARRLAKRNRFTLEVWRNKQGMIREVALCEKCAAKVNPLKIMGE